LVRAASHGQCVAATSDVAAIPLDLGAAGPGVDGGYPKPSAADRSRLIVAIGDQGVANRPGYVVADQ
jgi:hypothetical protein